MALLLLKEMRFKSITNSGELAKFYVHLAMNEKLEKAVIIHKLFLTKEPHPACGTLRYWKGKALQIESSSFKPETFIKITDFVKDFSWSLNENS